MMVMAMMASGQCKTFCYQRLQYLDAKWRLHDLLNGGKVLTMYSKDDTVTNTVLGEKSSAKVCSSGFL